MLITNKAAQVLEGAVSGLTVVHMSSVHTTYDTRIFTKECKSLASHGYKVSLVIPADGDHNRDGVTIMAVRRQTKRWKRFALTGPTVFLVALRQRGDIYHIHDPELLPYGLILKMLGKGVIYDSHEDVPKDILGKEWIPTFLRKVIARIAQSLIGFSVNRYDATIAATPAIKEALGISKHYVHVVQNFPFANEVSEEPPVVPSEPRLVYVGDLTSIRGVREMVRVVALIPRELNVKLTIVGKFSEKTLEQEMLALPDWKRYVEFHGWKDRDFVQETLRSSRVGLLLFHPLPNHVRSQPNKLFEYMAAGVPVVASNFTYWTRFITDYNCGLLVDPFQPQQVANACIKLLSDDRLAQDMGNNGKCAIVSEFNWEGEVGHLLGAYESVFQSRSLVKTRRNALKDDREVSR